MAITLGLAAGASASLAACYGAPRGYVTNQPREPWVAQWQVTTEPKTYMTTFERRAHGAACTTRHDHRMLEVRCPDRTVISIYAEGSSSVRVYCGPEDVCRATFSKIESTPEAESSDPPPVGTIAPPTDGDAG